jgi:hypothetical protein
LIRPFAHRRRPTTAGPPSPRTIDVAAPALSIVAAASVPAGDAQHGHRHPRLRGRDESLPSSEWHARHAAVRGLFNARSGDYEGARLAFADATREGALDLTALPGFWSLPRAGWTAAVLAYEDTGRLREAAALAAHLRTLPHSRPVAPLPTTDRLPSLERRHAAIGD